MKRLIIITEGPTEKRFVDTVLSPYLINKGIYSVSATSIRKKGQKGGFVNYEHLRNHLKIFLLSEVEIVITTMIDFFRIPNSVPNYNLIENLFSVDEKIDLLEEGIKADINDARFIPFIQKHEFEALLFSSIDGFDFQFDNKKLVDKFKDIIDEFDNPENINTRPEFSPANRIKNILKGYGLKYDKPEDGETISTIIGIEIMLEKCPRFKIWINRIIEKMQR